MIGSRLGHYRISDRIGAGGMGEVYRARDEHLDRDVALKVLPAGLLADEQARRRFRREAHTLSRLNHPNIATIHDFATYDGTDVLVMEYVAGQTMSDRLKAGALGEEEAVRLGILLVEGLAAAHADGVVHRDLKPGNLRILPDGRLKILDFGLATLRQRAAGEQEDTRSLVTEVGVSGTLPYMSPEQVRGQPADARSDTYAAGVTLYEMVTSERPFRDTDALRLADAILHEPCPPPGRLAPRLSQGFEQIILKCTEKDPALRYQSAAELLVDLRRLSAHSASGSGVSRPFAPRPRRRRRWAVATAVGVTVVAVGAVLAWRAGLVGRWGGDTTGAPARRIAVLPLENLSGDPGQVYFADGMTEAFTTDLARIRALEVISSTSAMRYKGTKKSLPQIASELKADAVVTGSIVHVGSRVRITARLVQAASDRVVWTRSYDRELRDVLELQGEVARTVAQEIAAVVTPAEREQLERRRRPDPVAYDLGLRGVFHSSRMSVADMDLAIGYFARAVATDPAFAEAQAGLAQACLLRAVAVDAGLSEARRAELLARARASAARAADIDDTIAAAHAALAAIALLLDTDLTKAKAEVERALELSPNHRGALFYSCLAAIAEGRRDEARQQLAAVVEFDPVNPSTYVEAGEASFWMRDYDRGVEFAKRGLELEPTFARSHFVLGRIYEAQGWLPQAIAEYEKGGWGAQMSARARQAFESGGRIGYDRWQLELQLQRTGVFRNLYLARSYVRLNRLDDAVAALERAAENREPLLFLMTAIEWFEPLHADPRFIALAERLRLPLR